MKIRWFLPVLFFGILWLPVLEILELEWRYNEQYHFGYFVPFFTLYLLYLRWEDRPGTKGSGCSLHWAWIPVILISGFQVIQTANPDWRLVYWAMTLNALAITVIWMHAVGGTKWMFHFLPALLMILFSVPWIVTIENKVTNSLMAVVSGFTVETLNLAGIYAVQLGNVIHLRDSVVGIEEACSGVRSLQSSIMAAYLFGEIIRFRPSLRLLLILLGVGITFILNLARTMVLTLITINEGHEAFEQWHDTIGNTVAITGFLLVALTAWILSKFIKNRPSNSPASIKSSSTETSIFQEKNSIIVVFSMLLILGFLFDIFWYRNSSAKTPEAFDYSAIQWESLGDQVEQIEIDPAAVAQLKYSEGSHYQWITPENYVWNAFYLSWTSGNISSHAGVHRPENCLPATGITLHETHEILTWDTPHGYQIPFRAMTFEGFGKKTYVFFAVWDENGSQPWISVTWKERLEDVLQRRIVNDRHSLQFLVANINSYEQAKTEWFKLMKQLYTVNH